MPRLTAKSAEAARARTDRVELPDGHGLYLVLQAKPSRVKTWALRYRYGGRSVKLTLGRFVAAKPGQPVPDGCLTLAMARVAATDALAKLERGINPKTQYRPTKPTAESFESVAVLCLTREAKRLRSADRQLRDLKRLAFPTLGGRAIADIRRGDIVRLLDKIEDENGPVMADSVLSTISKVTRWHMRREDAYAAPIIPGMRRSSTKERARDRILNDSELRAVWLTAETTPTFGPYMQFLLLTGCRRDEAVNMRRDEVADGVWVLPPERSKSKRAIARPLSGLAQQILARLPVIAPGDLYFTADGRHAVSTSHPKAPFDTASGVAGWRLHDLRRTSRSLLSRAGVRPDIAERLLGHVVGSGVSQTYDRHQYTSEMQQAAEALATLIQHIVHPVDNVLPFADASRG